MAKKRKPAKKIGKRAKEPRAQKKGGKGQAGSIPAPSAKKDRNPPSKSKRGDRGTRHKPKAPPARRDTVKGSGKRSPGSGRKKRPSQPQRRPLPGVRKSDVADRMRASLEASLDRLREERPDVEAGVTIHVNKDGSVDGELRVSEVEDVQESIEDLQIAVKLPRIRGTWAQAGTVFQPFSGRQRDIDMLRKLYDRFKGRFQVKAHFQRPEKIQLNFRRALGLANKIEERERGTVDQVFVRLHWDREGSRPKAKKRKKRGKK